MAILNITPNSFSDGGKVFLSENAVKQAEKLVAKDADILDIGADGILFSSVFRHGFVRVAVNAIFRRKPSVKWNA